MEIIRKKICFEPSISRQQGLLAFIEHSDLYSETKNVNTTRYEEVCKVDLITGERYIETVAVSNEKIRESDFSYVTMSDKDGNYGRFVCNPYFSGGTGAELFGVGYVNYMDIISRYNKIHNMLFDGLKLKRIVIHNDIYYVDGFDNLVNLYDYNVVAGSDLIEVSKGKFRADDDTLVYETVTEVNECGIETTVKKATTKKIDVDYGQFVNCIKNYEELISLCAFFGGIENMYTFLRFVEDNFIGILPIPAEITGDSVPEFLYYSDIVEWYEWFKKNEGSSDCCVVKKWKDRGGDVMYAFLAGHLNIYQNALDNAKKFFKEDTERDEKEINRHIPKINVSVLLTTKFDDIGIVSSYIDPDEDYRFSEGGEDVRINEGTANSRLLELRSPIVSHDDAGNELPGVLQKRPLYYDCTDNGSRWRKINEDRTGNASVNLNTVNLTIPPLFLSEPDIGLDEYTPGIKFCDKDRVRSSYSNVLSIPFACADDDNGYVINAEYVKYYYEDGEYLNVKESSDEKTGNFICCEMVGDFINKITISHDGNKIRFEYTIQGHYWAKVERASESDSYSFKFSEAIPGTGIVYAEEFDYYPNREIGPYMFYEPEPHVCDDASVHISAGKLEGRSIKMNYIDFDSARVRIRHNEFNIERDGLIANIVDYPAGDVWRSGEFTITGLLIDDKSQLKTAKSLDDLNTKPLPGYSRESIKTPIYKEEALNGIKADINVKINFSVDRGTVASREMHYKLSECNTLEDMENYGNNYFNLKDTK